MHALDPYPLPDKQDRTVRNFTDTEVALIERFREEYDVPGVAVALVQDRASGTA